MAWNHPGLSNWENLKLLSNLLQFSRKPPWLSIHPLHNKVCTSTEFFEPGMTRIQSDLFAFITNKQLILIIEERFEAILKFCNKGYATKMARFTVFREATEKSFLSPSAAKFLQICQKRCVALLPKSQRP